MGDTGWENLSWISPSRVAKNTEGRIVGEHHAEMEPHQNRRPRHAVSGNPLCEVIQAMSHGHELELLLLLLAVLLIYIDIASGKLT